MKFLFFVCLALAEGISLSRLSQSQDPWPDADLLQQGRHVAHKANLDWKAAAAAVGGAFVLGAVLAAGVAFSLLREKKDDESGGEQEGEQTNEPTADAPLPEKTFEASPPVKDNVPANDTAPMDYESMLRQLAERVSQGLGPQAEKGKAVRKILETRASSLGGKAKAFVLNELNSTAGALMKAFESEESMLLLDFDSTMASYFPPLPVLFAGLLSPTVLMLSLYNHLIQVLVVHLPILILCAWAAWEDWDSECFGVPTLYIWIYFQGVLTLVLTVSHLIVSFQIMGGQAALKAKTEGMRGRLENQKQQTSGAMGFSDVRELFVCSSVLLQQALIAEERVRKSFFNDVIGFGTMISIITTVWNVILAVGWVTIPGQLAFHPKAKAVVPANQFCGAWASIIVIRCACLLSALFLLFNFLTVAQWISDKMMHSSSYTSGMMERAKKFDKGQLGIPVAQTLVKAFLLRSDADMVSAQLAVTSSEKESLEKEKAEVAARLTILDAHINQCRKDQQQLASQVEEHNGKDDLEANITHLEQFGEKNMEEWKIQGTRAIQAAQAKEVCGEEAKTADLEKLIEKVQDVAVQIQESKLVDSARIQGSEIAGQASKAASSGMAQASAAAVQAQQAATEGLAQAAQVAETAVKSEAAQKAVAQAKQAAAKAHAAATEAVEKVQKKSPGKK